MIRLSYPQTYMDYHGNPDKEGYRWMEFKTLIWDSYTPKGNLIQEYILHFMLPAKDQSFDKTQKGYWVLIIMGSLLPIHDTLILSDNEVSTLLKTHKEEGLLPSSYNDATKNLLEIESLLGREVYHPNSHRE